MADASTTKRDHDHLKLLSIFHYVNAALLSCSTSIGVIYIGFMASIMPMIASEIEAQAARERAAAKQAEVAAEEEAATSESTAKEEDAAATPPVAPVAPPAPAPVPPPFDPGQLDSFFSMFSGMLYVIGAISMAFGFAMAFANVYTARCIALRKHRMVCLLTAGFNCLNMPLGLALGVCSFLVLLRPSVEDLFEGHQTEQAAAIEADIID